MQFKIFHTRKVDVFDNKSKAVREHIRRFGYIDTNEANRKYRATRLSSIIYNAKTEHGGDMHIETVYFESRKKDRRTKQISVSHFAVYYDPSKVTQEKLCKIYRCDPS